MIAFPTASGKLGGRFVSTALVMVVLCVASAYAIKLVPSQFEGFGQKFAHWIHAAFTSIDFAALPNLTLRLLETFGMAFVASVVAAVLSVPIAFLASSRTTPWQPLAFTIRAIFAVLRTIPDLVFAIAFVSAFGLGPTAGVFALTITTMAFLVKFHYESLDVAPVGPEMGVAAHGAGWLATRLFGIVPSALPQWVSQWVYSIDSNVRSASILGFVGAGGIGFDFADSVRLLRYDRLIPIVIGIFLLVAILDVSSEVIRERLQR